MLKKKIKSIKRKSKVSNPKKKVTKRKNPERYHSSMGTMASPKWHANEPVDQLFALLDKRSAKAASSMTGTSYHYDGISSNIEDDIEYQRLEQNPSRKDLLNYLKAKKDVLEGVIVDFVRLT